MEEAILEKVEKNVGHASGKSPERFHDFLLRKIGDDAAALQWMSSKFTGMIPDVTDNYSGLGNSHRINDIRRVNKFLQAANRKLRNGQYIVLEMETKNARKRRILNRFPKIISYPYYTLDFILKRVFPKWSPTRKIYFNITKGRNRVMSLTEALGRLLSCGFEIVDYEHFDDVYRTCIIAKKVNEPFYNLYASYGAIIRLQRVGKGGKKINVYKLRTMYPFSEYLQDYMYQINDLEDGGKIKNDFRTTSWGRWFRRYWIDELPMFINYFKGELKLIGVRPISEQYFLLYPEDLRQMRTITKPGLIPPYYADMPNGLEEILESERKYLAAYQKKPIRTDLRYLGKVIVNIVLKGARSQ